MTDGLTIEERFEAIDVARAAYLQHEENITGIMGDLHDLIEGIGVSSADVTEDAA